MEKPGDVFILDVHVLALVAGGLHLRHRRAGHQDSIHNGKQGSSVAPPARYQSPPPHLGPAAGGTATPLVATSLASLSSSSSPRVCTMPVMTSPSSSSSCLQARTTPATTPPSSSSSSSFAPSRRRHSSRITVHHRQGDGVGKRRRRSATRRRGRRFMFKPGTNPTPLPRRQ